MIYESNSIDAMKKYIDLILSNPNRFISNVLIDRIDADIEAVDEVDRFIYESFPIHSIIYLLKANGCESEIENFKSKYSIQFAKERESICHATNCELIDRIEHSKIKEASKALHEQIESLSIENIKLKEELQHLKDKCCNSSDLLQGNITVLTCSPQGITLLYHKGRVYRTRSLSNPHNGNWGISLSGLLAGIIGDNVPLEMYFNKCSRIIENGINIICIRSAKDYKDIIMLLQTKHLNGKLRIFNMLQLLCFAFKTNKEIRLELKYGNDECVCEMGDGVCDIKNADQRPCDKTIELNDTEILLCLVDSFTKYINVILGKDSHNLLLSAFPWDITVNLNSQTKKNAITLIDPMTNTPTRKSERVTLSGDTEVYLSFDDCSLAGLTHKINLPSEEKEYDLTCEINTDSIVALTITDLNHNEVFTKRYL